MSLIVKCATFHTANHRSRIADPLSKAGICTSVAKEDNLSIFFPACQFCPSLQFFLPSFLHTNVLGDPLQCFVHHPPPSPTNCLVQGLAQHPSLHQWRLLPAESQHLPLLVSHAHAETRLDRSLASRLAALLCILPNSPMVTCALAWSTSMNCFNALRGPIVPQCQPAFAQRSPACSPSSSSR